MRSAFTSWKLAKGLYIIPIIMAYCPLLGMGETYQMLHWQVGWTMITSMVGLVAFAGAIERFFLRSATLIETALLWLAAAALFWPEYGSDIAGFLAFTIVIVLQKREITDERA